MPRVIQKDVKAKAEEWAKVQKRIALIEKKKNKKLSPLIEAHNEVTKEIISAFDEKIAPHRQAAAALEKEIKVLVEVDRDKDGNPKPITIRSKNAIVAVEKNEGIRVVNVKKYFDFVKSKSAEFWASLKVTIQDAEPIVGKNVIDDLSEKKVSYVSSVKLKK